MTTMTTETMKQPGFGPVQVGTDQALKLVMQELWLTGRVLPVGASLEVRHLFRCGETRAVEAVYAFMLPRDATLRRFRVIGENISVQSALKPTAEAVREYERGVEAGHLSALARSYRDGGVNLNLGNLRPGETIIVVLEILAGVETRDDGVRFRFPFTLAPTYHSRARFVESEPGVGEMELPEEEFGDVLLPPWMQNARDLHRVGFHLDVALGQPVAEIASPSHSIRVTQKEATLWRLALAPQADIPNRDLVVDARTPQPISAVVGGIGSDGKGQFIAVVPSTQFGRATGAPRQIVFVIDRSGSMQGAPLQQALRAVEACVGALSPDDRFGIVAFDDQTEVFQSGSVFGKKLCEADQKHRDAGRKFLQKLEARGGTELAAGLRAACELLCGNGGDIFVVTDGQVSGTEAIL
ncbi:MAG: VWA domain-containing protein, partial [Verrucomicrobiales bacterium]|nr:VWA domain-containing protein [Verrucomicrobiales bacterium]